MAGSYCTDGSAAPLPCPVGTHQNRSLTSPMSSEAQCVECDAGTLCPVGSANATECSPGFSNPLRWQPTCRPCEAGRYQNASDALDCWACEPGHYCLQGASAPLPCPSGTHQDLTLTTPMTSEAQCVGCGAGTFCPIGAETPTNCSAGIHAALAQQSECAKCNAGRYQDQEGEMACRICDPGSYCTLGASVPLPCPGASNLAPSQ